MGFKLYMSLFKHQIYISIGICPSIYLNVVSKT